MDFDRARGHEIGALLITLLVCPGFQDHGQRLVVYQSLCMRAGATVDGVAPPAGVVRTRLATVLTEHQQRTLEWNIALGRSVLPMLDGVRRAADAGPPARDADYRAVAPALHIAAGLAATLLERARAGAPGAWQDMMLDAEAVRRWASLAVSFEPMVARLALPGGRRIRLRLTGAGIR